MRIKPADQQAVRFIVDRMHVGTPDHEVEADIRRRADKALKTMAAPAGYVDSLVAYALKIHQSNRALYRRVMGGHIR